MRRVRAALFHLLIAAAALLVVPLGIRAANRLHPAANLQPTYLPAIEGPRERAPFDADRVPAIARHAARTWVVIGDSMAGSRIDPALLAQLDRRRRRRRCCSAGSGPACWYLALKNWVIPSGIRPRAVIVFFRDTNLTNVLFRIDATWALDTAAHDREDDLNAVVARRRGTAVPDARRVDRLYRREQARRWIEPAVNEWPARAIFPYRRPRAAFMAQLNERFGLAHLRPMDAADMQATEDREADFDAFVDKSTLPLMLRDARQAGLTLVLRARAAAAGRRPAAAPVARAAALRRRSSQAYVEANGGMLHGRHRRSGRRRSTSTRTATTCRATGAGATPRLFATGCASAFRDLPQPRLRRLFRPRRCDLLAAARTAGRTCCCWRRATSSTATSIPGS